MSVLLAGTIAIDNILTPDGIHHEELLGGSATFAAIAASFSSPVQLVAVVGEDFPREHLDLFGRRRIDTRGLDIVPGGRTFRWTGEYHEDMNSRETLETHINVLENFHPTLVDEYRRSRIVVLANMAPTDQLKVLDQCHEPAFVVADSMDLWINIARDELEMLLRRLDLFVINDAEARQFMETSNLITAGHRLREHGPRNVVIKKGEHGALVFGEDRFFSAGAYPLHTVIDPTGAGDTFLGGIAGHLAANAADGIAFGDICRAVVHGTVLASFNCESFSADRLLELSDEEISERTEEFRRFTTL